MAAIVKQTAKILFAAYLLTLAWLVLFKFSGDIPAVIAHFQTRSLNLVPFAQTSLHEMLYNLIAFIPFGLLLGVNAKQLGMWRSLAFVCAFSAAAEAMQYILAIGATDITDFITNTLGGLVGLAIHQVAKKYMREETLDRVIVVACLLVLIIFVALRTFVFKVRYQ